MATTDSRHTEPLPVQQLPEDGLHSLLRDIARLNRAVTLEEVLVDSLALIRRFLNTEAGSLVFYNELEGRYVSHFSSDFIHKAPPSVRTPIEEEFSGWMMDCPRAYYCNDADTSASLPLIFGNHGDFRNAIYAPLCDEREEMIGILGGINRREGSVFEEEDLAVAETLARYIAGAIERSQAHEKLKQDLEDKEVMLTEIHHRLKNNLSTLTALIEMELMEMEDEHTRRILNNTCSRIESMTEVHSLLYHSGLKPEIDLGVYLNKLTDKVAKTISDSSRPVSIDIEAEAVLMDSERAMICGLVLNELLVNACKHAFKNKAEAGKISVQLTLPESEQVEMIVSDDGGGMRGDFNFEDGDTVGSWIIKVLLRRLQASMDIRDKPGTSFRIRFPLKED